MKKKSDIDLSKVGGVLDIGAGDRPYADASVAVDGIAPNRPKGWKTHPLKGKLNLFVSQNAMADEGGVVVGLPLKLSKQSKLRLYYVGNAAALPDVWDEKFSEVRSRNAAFADPDADNPKVAHEMYAVLKKGGKVYILANPSGDSRASEQRHVDRIVRLLENAGFEQVRTTYSGGDFGFHAVKPVKSRIVRKGSRPAPRHRRLARRYIPPTSMGRSG